MNIQYFDIPAGQDSVKFHGIKLKAFSNRADALYFFSNMSMKSDMITVVVDSLSVAATVPELVTIREEIIKRP